MTWSSTKPNAFDGRAIAKSKWLQITDGAGTTATVLGTVSYSTIVVESFDTKTITLEKIIQG